MCCRMSVLSGIKKILYSDTAHFVILFSPNLSVLVVSLSKNTCRWLHIGLRSHFFSRSDFYPRIGGITLLVFPVFTSFYDRLSVSQPGHLPEVIADTDQLPYQPNLLQAPVPESPESKDLLDLPEHVLNQAGPIPNQLFPVYSR